MDENRIVNTLEMAMSGEYMGVNGIEATEGPYNDDTYFKIRVNGVWYKVSVTKDSEP